MQPAAVMWGINSVYAPYRHDLGAQDLPFPCDSNSFKWSLHHIMGLATQEGQITQLSPHLSELHGLGQ